MYWGPNWGPEQTYSLTESLDRQEADMLTSLLQVLLESDIKEDKHEVDN